MYTHFVPCGKIRNLQEVFEDERAKSFVKEEIIEETVTKRISSIAFQSW
jgi:hypothetical protein